MEPINVYSTQARSEAIRKYFTKTPSPPVYARATSLAVFAGLCALPALAAFVWPLVGHGHEWNGCLTCVSVMSLISAFLFAGFSTFSYRNTKQTYARNYHLAEPKPSDAQVDAWHDADKTWLKTYALRRLDLLPDQVQADNRKGPLIVDGAGPSAQLRTGRDGKVRFSSHEILIIYLTPYHLAAFKCVIDLHDGSVKTETTQEYHYDDVVSVSTYTDNTALNLYLEGQLRQAPTHERFAISVASGEQISVAIGFAGSLELDRNSTFEDTGAAAAIRVIRARLREKKGAQSTALTETACSSIV